MGMCFCGFCVSSKTIWFEENFSAETKMGKTTVFQLCCERATFHGQLDNFIRSFIQVFAQQNILSSIPSYVFIPHMKLDMGKSVQKFRCGNWCFDVNQPMSAKTCTMEKIRGVTNKVVVFFWNSIWHGVYFAWCLNMCSECCKLLRPDRSTDDLAATWNMKIMIFADIQHYATGHSNSNSILLKSRCLANRLSRLQRTKIIDPSALHCKWGLAFHVVKGRQRTMESK